jgi:hypothetical protein
LTVAQLRCPYLQHVSLSVCHQDLTHTTTQSWLLWQQLVVG